MTKLVCLDKDGTLLEDVPYNVDPARMRLTHGAADALRLFAASGYRLAVVSNQAGAGLGIFPESALAGVEDRLHELFASAGAWLEGFYCCTHRGGCVCRKPAPGMILSALSEAGADATQSWMVGDILDDIEAGRRAGCRTVLVDSGGETEWRTGELRRPHHVVRWLDDAARLIVAEDRQ